MKWFVEPETARLDVGDGQWIVVRKALNVGEKRKAQAAIVKVGDKGVVVPDFEMMGKAEAIAYLLDWSLCDASGKPVPIESDAEKLAAINAMSEEGFAAISQAIEAHVKAVQGEAGASKNETAGASASSAT